MRRSLHITRQPREVVLGSPWNEGQQQLVSRAAAQRLGHLRKLSSQRDNRASGLGLNRPCSRTSHVSPISVPSYTTRQGFGFQTPEVSQLLSPTAWLLGSPAFPESRDFSHQHLRPGHRGVRASLGTLGAAQCTQRIDWRQHPPPGGPRAVPRGPHTRQDPGRQGEPPPRPPEEPARGGRPGWPGIGGDRSAQSSSSVCVWVCAHARVSLFQCPSRGPPQGLYLLVEKIDHL